MQVGKAIQETYRKLTGRSPKAKELEILQRLREHEYRKFRQEKNKLLGWLNTGEYKVNEKLDPCQVAANAVVASAIMNSDAAITKR